MSIFSFARRDKLASLLSPSRRRAERSSRPLRSLRNRRLGHEPLEERTLLSLTVATDQPEYVLEAAAVVTVSGLTPGETIELQVLHADGTPNTGSGHESWLVVDGNRGGEINEEGELGGVIDGAAYDLDGVADGTIRTMLYVDEDDSAGSTFEITVTRLVSGEVSAAQFAVLEGQVPPLPSTTVQTDKSDYNPGETAIITASGFASGEAVEFQVLHIDDTPNTGAGHEPWQIIDGGGDDLDGLANGAIQTTWCVAADDSLDSVFVLTARGLTSGDVATTEFTDAQQTLLSDDFPTTSFDWNKWQYSSTYRAKIDYDRVCTDGYTGRYGGPATPPSAPYAVELDGDAQQLRSRSIDLSNYLSGSLYYSVQAEGHEDRPESSEDLYVQYRNSSGYWVTLRNEDEMFAGWYGNWNQHGIALPSYAFHSNFAFRFYHPYGDHFADDGKPSDDWFIDNVRLYATPNSAPSVNAVAESTGNHKDDHNHKFTWTASDSDGNLSASSVSAQLQRKTGSTWSQVRSATGFSGTLWQYPSDGLGWYRLKVTATDAKGATTTAYSAELYIGDDDTSKPTIAFTNAVDQSDGPDNYVGWSIADTQSGIYTRDVRLYRVSDGAQLAGNTTSDSGSFDLNHLAPGEYKIWATAGNDDRSWAGDQETHTNYTTFTIYDDDTDPPVIALGGSTGTEGHAATQEFTWNVTDATSGVGTVSVAVTYDDGATVSTIHTSTSPSGSFDFDRAGLDAIGAFAISVSATDADTTDGRSGDALSSSASRSVVVTNDPPVADAGEDQIVAEGAAVQFDATGSTDPDGDTLTYTWLFGDGESGTGAQPTHVYQDNGVYQVMLTVDDGYGGGDIGFLTVGVDNVDPQIASVTNDGPKQTNDPITVTVVAGDVAGNPLTYEFDFDNDGVYEVSNATGSAQRTFTAKNTYPVNVRVSDGDGGVATGWTAVEVGDPLNKTPVVSFVASGQVVSENVGAVMVEATLAEALSKNALVPLTVTGTAADGADYTLARSYFLIPAHATQAALAVSVTSDRLDELTETVTLTMHDPINASLGAVTSHTLTIHDDDPPPMVTFSAARQTVEEDAGSAKVTARLTALSGLDVTVPLAFSGTAMSPDDYTLPGEASILIPAGSYSGSATIPIVNDDDPERNERIQVSMLAPTNALLFFDLDGDGIQDPGESALPGMATVQTITIPENDAPSVSFSVAHRRVSESAGTISVTANLSAPYYNAVDVPFSVSGTAGSGDYSVNESSIHFDAHQTSATISVSVVNDSLGEEAETVVLTLSDPPGDARLGPTPSYVLEIGANDRPALSFVSTRGSFWETDASGNPVSATITARLSNTSTSPVEVPLVVYGGSAGVSDYILTSSSITIAPGEEYGSTTLQIVDDAETEESETVNLKMGSPTNGYINSYWPPRYTLTIQDDDPTVSFDSRSRHTVNEDGGYSGNDLKRNITAVLSAATNKPVIVPFEVRGTARQGADYTISPASSIYIPAYQTSSAIEVTARDDDSVEGTETVTVQMGVPTNAGPGWSTQYTIAIYDDDVPPTIYFESDGRAVEETPPHLGLTGQGNVDFSYDVTVCLSDYTDVPVTVDVSLSGTARNGSDYTISNTTMTIPAYASTATTTITVRDDSRWEPAETVKLSLRNPTNAKLGNRTTYTLEIAESDVPLVQPRPAPGPDPTPIYVPFLPPFTFAISTSGGVPVASSGSIASSLPPMGTVTTDPILSGVVMPGTFAISTGINGPVSGGTAFFDANKNMTLDFFDRNGDGIQDPDEPMEVSTTTAADGSFAIAVPEAFDLNQDGKITPDEGQFVVMGGIVGST